MTIPWRLGPARGGTERPETFRDILAWVDRQARTGYFAPEAGHEVMVVFPFDAVSWSLVEAWVYRDEIPGPGGG